MQKSRLIFVSVLGTCLLLTLICAWVFSAALAQRYPDGILFFPVELGEPASPWDSRYTGIAMGAFFCTLIYAAMSVSAFMLNRLQHKPLRHFTLPLITACVLSALACGGALWFAV